MATTIGKIMINRALPEEFRTEDVLDKDKADVLLAAIAHKYPEKYKVISHKLMQMGIEAVYDEGTTLKLSDTRLLIDRAPMMKIVDAKTREIMHNKDLSAADKAQAIEGVYTAVQKEITDQSYASALAANNPFALQVKSKARGNPSQLTALMSTPGLYEDAQGRIIPTFIRRSYAEGLKPEEYWAATYGARKSVIATKFATRDAGYLGKQFGTAANAIVVTEDDCGTMSGMPVKSSDTDSIGAVLAKDTAGFKAGTVITRPVLDKLQKDSEEIVVRSPTTCNAKQGLCKQCVGIRESGHFANIGDNVGINASSALAERIAQSSLNCLVDDTLVRMADYTIKRIVDVQVGDMVLGSDIYGHTFPVRVTAVWDQGIQPVSEYTYKMGGTKRFINVQSTCIHEFLQTTYYSNCKQDKLNYIARKLPAGIKAGRPRAVLPNMYTKYNGVRQPLAVILGYYMGDGIRYAPTTDKGATLKISCACQHTIDDMMGMLETSAITFNKLQASYDWSVLDGKQSATRVGSNGRYLKGLRNSVKQAVRLLGWEGLYCHDKQLPSAVYGWDDRALKEFVGGFLAADGSVYRNKNKEPGISFSSSSKAMLVGLMDLLEARLHVYCSNVTRIGHAGVGNRKHDQWQFCITRRDQVIRFSRLISASVPGPKGKKLCAYLNEAPYSKWAEHTHYIAGRVRSNDVGFKHCTDITVDHPDALFVLANGLICSNTKHSGGMAGQSGEMVYAGFPVVEQLAQIPKTFPNMAPLASLDGRIDEISGAAQGGKNIVVNGEKHYVPAGRNIYVKAGDTVEAGDQLAGGIVNPREIVKYKGIGEGRRYFTERMTEAFRDSKYGVNRRNMEIVARSMINHVKADELDGAGAALPGEVMAYNTLANRYKPRADAVLTDVNEAVGQYLEQPVLHHTIGTRITKSIAKQLGNQNHNRIMVHKNPAPFEADMLSLREIPQHEKDWVAQLGSNYLRTGLLNNVHRGATSNIHGLNPIPAVAKGTEIGDLPAGKAGY